MLETIPRNRILPLVLGGFRLGRIGGVDRKVATVDVTWLQTSGKEFNVKAKYRPMVGKRDPVTTVRVDECVYTFLALTSAGRMKAAHYRMLAYVMECREAGKTHAQVRQGEEAVSREVKEQDLEEYLEDFSTPVPHKPKKGRKRKATPGG